MTAIPKDIRRLRRKLKLQKRKGKMAERYELMQRKTEAEYQTKLGKSIKNLL